MGLIEVTWGLRKVGKKHAVRLPLYAEIYAFYRFDERCTPLFIKTGFLMFNEVSDHIFNYKLINREFENHNSRYIMFQQFRRHPKLHARSKFCPFVHDQEFGTARVVSI